MRKRYLQSTEFRAVRTFVLPLLLASVLMISGCGGVGGQKEGENREAAGASGSADASLAASSGQAGGQEAAGREEAGSKESAGSGTAAAAKESSSAGKTGKASEEAVKSDRSSTKSAGTGKESAQTGKTGKDTAQAGGTGKKSAGKSEPLIEKADGSTGEAEMAEVDEYAGFSEFTSGEMGFSFRYDPANTVDTTETGACQMTVGEGKDLVGLFVSSLSAENMPEPSQILEEEAGNVSQKYKKSLVQKPEKSRLTVDDHDLTGQTWAYSLPSGGTVECASYIEVRAGHYSFFRTEAMRGDTAPADQALKLAIRTLKFVSSKEAADDGKTGAGEKGSAKKASGKGESEKKDSEKKDSEKEDSGKKDSGETKSDNKESGEKEKAKETAQTVGIADLTGGGADEKESRTETFGDAYSFDVDGKWLVVPDGTTTTVYTRGSMQGAYFVVDKTEMEEKPANYLSNRGGEIKGNLGARLITEPEVRTVELGERKLTGIEYEYVSADGARNYFEAEYIETTALGSFLWQLTCSQGDNESVAAMLSAMETFMPN